MPITLISVNLKGDGQFGDCRILILLMRTFCNGEMIITWAWHNFLS
jgi:hypothetical protein